MDQGRKKFDERFTFILDADLKRQVSEIAEERGYSLAEYIRKMMRIAVDITRKKNGPR